MQQPRRTGRNGGVSREDEAGVGVVCVFPAKAGNQREIQKVMKTIHEYRGYVFSIEFSGEYPEWTVVYEDFDDIFTGGSTLEEAFQNSCGALDLHLESMQKLGESLPKPKRWILVVSC
ncbi:MAG: type II toxin-antitoxin system HicB family antitoxin [Candidatus Hatepunaea meridiana]|nr:type II toxin-antitoxin system HicB family antitoxin [Candidatus Hatepunaea meridiana]